MEKLEIIYKNISEIKPYKHNAKLHPAEHIAQIAKSIQDFGFNDPIAVDEDGVIIEGHGRLEAAKKLGMDTIPVIVLDGLTDQQKKAYVLAHNQLTMNTGFDLDVLADELERITEFDMSDFGFLDNVFEEAEDNPETVKEDEVPEPPLEPKAKRGEIYQLGKHRLMCGDSTSADDVAKLMNGEKADLVFTDPPYGMKKEAEGVANDNLNYDDLLEFNKKWIPLTFNALKENGSWYCWGTDEPLMDIYSNILKPMIKENKATFRNLLTWDKGNSRGQLSADFRMYPVADEKCLFVMCGVQGFNSNQDNYFDGWEPVRAYLAGEAEKVGLTPKKLKEICGVCMWSHWFTKSQFAFITEDHYKELQAYYRNDAFMRDYDEIKRDYDETRAYFNNTHDNMNNVWHFDRAGKEERVGHATPKPLALCARAIKSSSRQDELVLDVFGGSGSTMMACEQLGRRCNMMELEPRWVDVIIERWQNLTGQKAELLERGSV